MPRTALPPQSTVFLLKMNKVLYKTAFLRKTVVFGVWICYNKSVCKIYPVRRRHIA